MNNTKKIPITDPQLQEEINRECIKCGKDVDGDIIDYKGHTYFVHIIQGVYSEIVKE